LLHRATTIAVSAAIVATLAVAITFGSISRSNARCTQEAVERLGREVRATGAAQAQALVLVRSLRALIAIQLQRNESPELIQVDRDLLMEQCRLEGKAIDYVGLECTDAPTAPTK
jgi:hypothetical protein